MLAVTRMTTHRATALVSRTRAIAAHMSTSAGSSLDDPVIFQSSGCARTFVLNRANKLNALNTAMLDSLRAKLEVWAESDLCRVIIGRGEGRAFCAGGDVASVMQDALDGSTRSRAVEFFKKEFELDYILSQFPKPYVAILDGITMGGGAGLAINAPFRVATENTVFAMPETKIGYFPDVGASYFLSRLDGEVGTYLALTSEVLMGREVFEHGLATHYITSRSVPNLVRHLAEFESPSFSQINRTIEELHAERQLSEPGGKLTGSVRHALDTAFRQNSVEEIFASLEGLTRSPDALVQTWATETLKTLDMRSPTSLKVALSAIRRGKEMTLSEALQMEIGIVTAYCSGASPDFRAGVSAVLIDKIRGRPGWSPEHVTGVSSDIVERFFSDRSSYRSGTPKLSGGHRSQSRKFDLMTYGLPSETELSEAIRSCCEKGPVTVSELISMLDGLCKRKYGIKDKILEVVHRKCDVVSSDGTETITWKGDS